MENEITFDPTKEQNSVVCFLWNDGFREYLPEHVNRLYALITKHLSLPHRFICVTDEEEGFDEGIELFKLPEEASWIKDVKTLENKRLPSSYRRLWLFSKEAKCLGDRILMLDIDAMVVNSIDNLFTIDSDFIGWRPRSEFRSKIKTIDGARRIGGGTWLLRTGTHTYIWENFSEEGQRKAKRAGWRGSDQAWLSYNLAKTCEVFPDSFGIYHTQDGAKFWKSIPEDASIIHFNGKIKPWDSDMLSREWVCTFFGVPYDKEKWESEEFVKKVSKGKNKFSSDNGINILTCLWGGKFNKKYVEVLYHSIKRNTKIPFKFWCLTDMVTKPLKSDKINYMPMELLAPINKTRILNKIYAYKFADKYLNGKRVFVFDLDTIIIGKLDDLLCYSGDFCMRRAFCRKNRVGGDLLSFVGGFGSAWYKYIQDNLQKVIETTKGSERSFYENYTKKKIAFWQDLFPNCYLSYKNNIKKRKGTVLIKRSNWLVSCHGHPMPHEINEPWVKRNWRV